jgi:hypothetical protein
MKTASIGGPTGRGNAPKPPPRQPSPNPTSTTVRDAVVAELAPLPGATTRPAIGAAALNLAAILDDPRSAPHRAAAAGALGEILVRLHGGQRSGGTRLVAMRAVRRDE